MELRFQFTNNYYYVYDNAINGEKNKKSTKIVIIICLPIYICNVLLLCLAKKLYCGENCSFLNRLNFSVENTFL
jgi:hypothetical protein